MDRYSSYAELSAREREGIGYRIIEVVRPSQVVVLAPHGGCIEPTTSLIAAAIAGDDHSLYCFEGLRRGRPHGDLHITSARFDEQRAMRLVTGASIAVAVHGRLERTDPDGIWLGGLDAGLMELAAEELRTTGFRCRTDVEELAGKGPANICNCTTTGQGLQLELPPALRDRLRDDAELLLRLAGSIRTAIAVRPARPLADRSPRTSSSLS